MNKRLKIFLAIDLVMIMVGLAILNSLQTGAVVRSVLTTMILACMMGVVAIIQFSKETL